MPILGQQSGKVSSVWNPAVGFSPSLSSHVMGVSHRSDDRTSFGTIMDLFLMGHLPPSEASNHALLVRNKLTGRWIPLSSVSCLWFFCIENQKGKAQQWVSPWMVAWSARRKEDGSGVSAWRPSSATLIACHRSFGAGVNTELRRRVYKWWFHGEERGYAHYPIFIELITQKKEMVQALKISTKLPSFTCRSGETRTPFSHCEK